ncbi:NAD(P)/FAD-dependent oxidoreductase [Skermania piniformis]|uniref:FAD-dependent oxidoreductase n=1 Tax=Skermania pinensis TaxID=39122 RepID=A0ABX8SB59_9ACTN|nr:FAD-dependent oxidoreductase [Skermania piniformis]QXQ14222.1 FAD-dependent oxidoreductase [Skermania piniformis]
MTDPTPAQVVVLGGGYAGVMAANRLRRDADLDITLVNPRPQFVERIRLHQQVAGTGEAAQPLDDLLGDGIELVCDAATRIDGPARQVQLAGGRTLDYDYLIYAIGSRGGAGEIPGAAEFAWRLDELEPAQQLRARLDELPATAPVTVVGAGLTGIEVAAEFAETGRPVTLVGDTLAPSVAEPARRSIARTLAALGVTVITGTRAAAVRADHVQLADGREPASDVTIWTAGFTVPGLADAGGLATDPVGRLLTDETLTSVTDPRIVAAGDAAAPSGRPLRMSCQSALPLGAQAAATILSRLAGTEPMAVDQAFAGQCISVGRRRGVIQLTRRDDTPRRVHLGGRTGALVKEQICRSTVRFLRWEQRRPGSYHWLRGGRHG